MASKNSLKSYAYVWDGVLLYAPRAMTNTRHAHFPATVLMAVDQPFALTLDDGERRYHEIAVLAPNVYRETDSEGNPLVDFLIDPDDPLYCYLHPLLNGRSSASLPGLALGALRPRFRTLFQGGMTCGDAQHFVLEALRALCPEPAAELPWDSRVRQAAAFMRRRIPGAIPAIPEVAAAVGLSESRLMHLFRAELGLPIRQYLLWLRIRQAMRLWAQGLSLAEMAVAAGFYDQAHFTRTLRRMTDYAPSMLHDPVQMRRFDCAIGACP